MLERKSSSRDISVEWSKSLDRAKKEVVHGYVLRGLYSHEEASLHDQVNSWLSNLDEVEEIWGDVNESDLELRVSRLKQPGSYSDESYLAVDLDSPYVVEENGLPDSEYHLLDLSAAGTSTGLPKADAVASFDYEGLRD